MDIIGRIIPVDSMLNEAGFSFLAALLEAKCQLSNPTFALDYLIHLAWDAPNLLAKFLVSEIFLIVSVVANCGGVKLHIDIKELGGEITFYIKQEGTLVRQNHSWNDFYDAAKTLGFVFGVAAQSNSEFSETAYGLGEMLFVAMLIIKPNDAQLYFELGNYRDFALRHDLEAVAAYVKATEIKPDFAEAYKKLCISAYLAGDRDTATEAFNKAFTLDKSVFEKDSIISDSIEEFLALEGRIEDWLYIKALMGESSAVLARQVKATADYLQRISLTIEEFKESNHFSMHSSEQPENLEVFSEDMIKLSEWLRSQPLQVKRDIAARFWKNMAHKLPEDPIP